MPLPIRPLLAVAFLANPVLADDYRLLPSGQSYEDTTFAVEDAIVARGLVIDYVSHVGEMLERTRADMGSETVLFANGSIFLFCSASISRQAMETNWQNVAFCPYGISVLERPGEGVVVGYMHRDAEGMAPVNALLEQIVADALD